MCFGGFLRRLVVVGACAGALAGCERAGEGRAATSIRGPEDLRARSYGSVVGSAIQDQMHDILAESELRLFNDYPTAVVALILGKIDCLPIDTIVARSWVAHRPSELEIAFQVPGNPIGYFFAKGSPLRAQVNDILRRLKDSGKLDRVIAKWCDAPDCNAVEFERWDEFPSVPDSAPPLRFVGTCDSEPAMFLRNDEFVGFDIDLVTGIARALGRKLEIISLNLNAIVPAVQTGKADMGGGSITITPARQERVDFTESYDDDGYAFVVQRKAVAGEIRSLRDLNGRHVAHLSSDFHRDELVRIAPNVIFDPYSEYAFAFESLRTRKIDALSLGRVYAEIWMAKFPGEFKIVGDYSNDVCAFLLPKGSPYKSRIDAELRRMADAGELEAIVRKWSEAAKRSRAVPLPVFPPPNADAEELHVAAAAQAEPWCFAANGAVAGSDIEILMTIAHRLGLKLVTKLYSWGGMVDAVNAGKTDIACGGIYTNGLDFPTVDASEPFATVKMCIMARDESYRSAWAVSDFFDKLGASFVRTFVTEERWRMVARGFGITLFITLCATLIGTLLAFLVWFCRVSRVKAVAALARGYIAVFQGTPILVILMVLFYIVFGTVDIDGIWVAIIGFALNLSAYAGEALRSGVAAVPVGQMEAALSLGYPPFRAFCRFVLPQAIRLVLPVYRGDVIGLLKATSIVGYIAINDLTKASDLIRSRTYESFFPILTTAFIYFLASWALTALFECVSRRLDPARS